MIINENEVLKQVFWPLQKENILGNMIYSHTDENFTATSEISVVRQDRGIEIAYTSAPVLNPTDKSYFVKLFFAKNEDGTLSVDKKKSSPELVTDKDVTDVLETVQNAIVKMNAKPDFFPTGVVLQVENKMKLH